MTFAAVPDIAAPLILAAGLACPAAPAPAVTLDFQNTPAQYTSAMTSAQLGQFKIDTKFSHGPREVFKTGGLTQSNVKTTYKLKTSALNDPNTSQSCAWIESISLQVAYEPTVYIASEYQAGSCRYNVTAQHELRHVNTDVITLNEYTRDLQASVQALAAQMHVRGPFATTNIDRVRDELNQTVANVVQAQSDTMERRRFQRQQLIDTRQEYLRLSGQCPGEPSLLR